MDDYARQYADYQAAVETALRQCLPQQPQEEGGRVIQAARYILFSGGKRLRPILLLAASQMLGVDQQDREGPHGPPRPSPTVSRGPVKPRSPRG